MNSILKILSTLILGISTVSFGQLLIPEMPLSGVQSALPGQTLTMPLTQQLPTMPNFPQTNVPQQTFSPTQQLVGQQTQPMFPQNLPTAQQQILPAQPVVQTIQTAPAQFQPQQTFFPTQQFAEQQTQPAQTQQIIQQPTQTQGGVPQNFSQNTPINAAPQNPLQFATSENHTPTDYEKKSDGDKEKKEIYLNFENSDLSSFVNYMAELKNLNLIPDPGLEAAKISLTIRQPLSIEGAWNVFLTVLDTAGFAIVQTGDVWKVQTKDKKFTQPLPAYINIPSDQLPDNDLTIRYVFFLTNIQVADIQQLLESMLSQPNVVVPLPQVNAFVITDKSLNIKAAVKLIQELDQEGLPEEVSVLRLKRANATDVKVLLDALIAKPDINPLARLLGKVTEGTTSYFSPTTRIIPEERTNSLILLGNKKSIDKIVDFITNQIDTELKATESPLHVFELQYADATAVMDILKEVTASPESLNGQAASKYGSIRGGVKYFKAMNFKVDKEGNRLIVSSTDKQDWKLLKKTIEDLDKPQPQVAIETLIVLVNVSDTKELGGAMRNKKHGQLGINTDFQASTLGVPALERVNPDDPTSQPISLLGNLLTQLSAEQGAALLSFGKESSVWSVLKILKQFTNTSILSQPSITVANKTQAQIQIGKEIRVTQATVNAGTGATSTGKQSAVAATTLKITPQINPDGLVRLAVELNVNDFTDDSGNNQTKKNVITNVTVADGQVLVLGGFVQTKTGETTNKVPLLGDIPLLGWFFKDQRRTVTKEYTFVFMSPTIIKPRQSPGTGLYTKMKFHQATDDIENSIETKRVKDPIHNWFFNPEKENYSHKVIDFANARYQPTTVDIRTDPYYRSSKDNDDRQPQHRESQRTNEMSYDMVESTHNTSPMEKSDEPTQGFLQEEQQENQVQELSSQEAVMPMLHPQAHLQEPALPLFQPQQSIPESITPQAQQHSQQQLLLHEPKPPLFSPQQRTQSLAKPMRPPLQHQIQENFAQPSKQLQTQTNNTTSRASYNEQKELAALEREIEQRRRELRASIALPVKNTQDPRGTTKPSLAEKRKSLKDFITHVPQMASENNQREIDTFRKRNNLKDFLANNPANALNNRTNDLPRGKTIV